jgi:hypothetical protein
VRSTKLNTSSTAKKQDLNVPQSRQPTVKSAKSASSPSKSGSKHPVRKSLKVEKPGLKKDISSIKVGRQELSEDNFRSEDESPKPVEVASPTYIDLKMSSNSFQNLSSPRDDGQWFE